MKAWFVYLISGKKIGVWANNNAQAEINLRREYGDVQAEFIGVNYSKKFGVQPDNIIYSGMSPIDVIIATGMMNVLIGLR